MTNIPNINTVYDYFNKTTNSVKGWSVVEPKREGISGFRTGTNTLVIVNNLTKQKYMFNFCTARWYKVSLRLDGVYRITEYLHFETFICAETYSFSMVLGKQQVSSKAVGYSFY